MKLPFVDLVGHLSWTKSGVVWATWRVQAQPYGMRPLKKKREVKDLHRMLLRALQGEALIMGVTVDVDEVAVIERQIAGVDLDQCPDWAAEAEANLDRLSELALGERVFYLSVPLANPGSTAWKAAWMAATGQVRDVLQLPRCRPTQREIEFRKGQADLVMDAIPSPFRPRPISVAEQVWLAAHAQRRGMVDMPTPEPTDALSQELLVPKSGVVLPEPILDEGARSDLGVDESAAKNVLRAAGRVVDPVQRRYLKVQDPRALDLGQDASYQAMLVLTDTPVGGMTFPGSEFLGRVDDWGLDVDWAVRLRLNARDKVMRANRKAVRDLNDQFSQRDGEDDGQHELDSAAELLGMYQKVLSDDRLEVEVEHTVIFAVAGASTEEVDHRAKALAAQMSEGADLKVERPVGAQEELWWAMQPGPPATRAVRAFAQFTTSNFFAMSTPFITTTLGGNRGPVAAVNTSSARAGVIHLNPGGYPEINRSGSLAFCGDLGAGKSYGMKTCASNLVDLGGQILVIDRSAEGEWATFAASIAESVVVNAGQRDAPATWTMDPLRVMEPDVGPLVAQSFLTQLLGTSPQEARGRTVTKVLSRSYLDEHNLTSLRQVLEHLLSGDCALHEAQDIGEHLRTFAELPMGAVVFDEDLPPVSADAAAIVWRTHGMEQPTEDELSQAHLYRSLRPEKIFGRCYYHLLVSCARRWAFQNRARVVCLICDEAHDIYSNPENDRELEFFNREGRRAKALLMVGSHDPAKDFGSETARSLIPTRIVMRQTDDDLAKKAVRYLGIPEEDPEFESIVEAVMADLSPVDPADPDKGVIPGREGECFIRDAWGGIGRGKLLGPARQERAAAVSSTPPKARSSA